MRAGGGAIRVAQPSDQMAVEDRCQFPAKTALAFDRGDRHPPYRDGIDLGIHSDLVDVALDPGDEALGRISRCAGDAGLNAGFMKGDEAPFFSTWRRMMGWLPPPARLRNPEE